MRVPLKWSYSFIEPIKRHRAFVSFMLILISVCVFAGVLAGIRYNRSSLIISFSNVTIVKFLRSSTGFGGMLFSNLFIVLIFSIVIAVSCCKKYCISIGIFFYGYYVYAQTLTVIAFMLEYGIINTFVVVVCLILNMIALLFLFLQIFLVGLDAQCDSRFFKSMINNCLPIMICIIGLVVMESVVFFVLRNFIIVLVY